MRRPPAPLEAWNIRTDAVRARCRFPGVLLWVCLGLRVRRSGQGGRADFRRVSVHGGTSLASLRPFGSSGSHQGVQFGPEDQVQDRPLPPAHLPSELGVLIKAIATISSVWVCVCVRGPVRK